jgi:hypothetical protein
MEIVSVIANIFTALATIALAIVAGFALYTWKKEFIGKKKIELAAEIMEAACDIQDLTLGARLNVYSQIELKNALDWITSEKNRDPQNTEIMKERLHLLIPHLRILAGQDKIDRLRSLFNKSYLYWGKDIMKLIYDLIGYTLQIRTASKSLYYGDFPEKHQEFATILTIQDGNTEFDKKVTDTIDELKLNLEPLYKDAKIKWKKLDPNKKGIK